MEQMTISKFKNLIDGEKLFGDIKKKTRYYQYFESQNEINGSRPTIVDYIIHLEVKNELYYIEHLQEQIKELKEENEKLKKLNN